jgi:8-oxo-dGTP pyrophosphatase MutT (NUDIX family)
MAEMQVAHAVLICNGRYVLQLRDDRPDITAAGKWALFGGGVEPGEDPLGAVVREVREELCLGLADPLPLWSFRRRSELGRDVLFSFFEADVTAQWGRHRLIEGQAVDCFSFGELADLAIRPVIMQALRRHHSERPL